MTRRLKAKLRRDEGAFIKAFMSIEEPIARAATAAVGEAGDAIIGRELDWTPLVRVVKAYHKMGRFNQAFRGTW